MDQAAISCPNLVFIGCGGTGQTPWLADEYPESIVMGDWRMAEQFFLIKLQDDITAALSQFITAA